MVGSTAIGHVLLLATLPVIGRLYDPAEIGRLGAFAAFLGTASVATALQYDVMMVSAHSEREAVALFAGVCAVTGPVALIASAMLAWLSSQAYLGFEILPLNAAFWMFAALVVTQLFFTLRYWVMRDEAFGQIAKVTVLQSGVRAIAPILLYPLSATWVSLVAAEVVGRCAGLRTLLRGRGRALREAARGLQWTEVARAFRRLPQVPLAGVPSALINASAQYLPLPLVASGFGATAAGYFGVVQRAMQAPIILIGRNVADVFHARVARHVREAPERVVPLFWRTALALLLVGAIPSFLIVLVGRFLLVTLLGPRWAEAGDLLAAMVPWSFASFVVSPLSRAILVFRGQALKLIYDGLSLTGVVVVFSVARRLNAPLNTTVWMWSWTQAAAYVVYFLVLTQVVRRAPPSAPSLPMAAP